MLRTGRCDVERHQLGKVLTPLRQCRHCDGYVKDYGGKLKRFVRQGGVHLSDVWNDLTAVRHKRFKSEKLKANQLSTKILERVVAMTTEQGDLALDVFGGAGTTFAVCEAMGRRWLGSEAGSCDAIIERLTTPRVDRHRNDDIVED